MKVAPIPIRLINQSVMTLDHSVTVGVAMAVCCAAQHAIPHSTAQHLYALQYNISQV